MRLIYLIFCVLLTSCTISEMDQAFLNNIEGSYRTIGIHALFSKEINISKSGDFSLNGQKFQFLKALTPYTAEYKIDDTAFAGILLDTKNILKYEVSKSGDIKDIPNLNTSKNLIDIAEKK